MANLQVNREVIEKKKLKEIFNHIDTMRNHKQIKMMFYFNFLGMMRCINFCYLSVGDVIDESGNIRDFIILTPEKNKGKSKAKYFVSNELKKHIKEYLADFNVDNRDAYLFVSPKTGRPYNRSYLSQLFSSIYGVFNYHCASHYGRRYAISSLVHSGCDISSVKTLANHKHISTTDKYVIEDDNFLMNSLNTVKIV